MPPFFYKFTICHQLDKWNHLLYRSLLVQIHGNFNHRDVSLWFKFIDENVNKRLKATLIDRSNIIYPRRDLKEKNKFYITFYFTKTQCLKINNKYEKIVALSIIYNFDNISYEDIIDELDKNIFIKNKNLSVDERLDFDMLSNYMRGKNILVLKEKKDDTNQRGIIATRDFFDEDTKNSKLIINYNE